MSGKKESVFDRLDKVCPLEIRILVSLQMEDYENWNDGTYRGDQSKLVRIILEDVEQWLKQRDAPLRRNGKVDEYVEALNLARLAIRGMTEQSEFVSDVPELIDKLLDAHN